MHIEQITKQQAKEMVTWRYGDSYSLYDFTNDEETVREILQTPYYSVTNDEKDVIGFFSFGTDAQVPSSTSKEWYADETYLDIGLGLHPNLCGKGLGETFLKQGLQFATTYFKVKKFRLTVADFNERAIQLYKKVGFQEIGAFIVQREERKIRFLVMTYKKGD